jgi:hypothetical protein
VGCGDADILCNKTDGFLAGNHTLDSACTIRQGNKMVRMRMVESNSRRSILSQDAVEHNNEMSHGSGIGCNLWSGPQ